jgi:chromosome segregation ATPase
MTKEHLPEKITVQSSLLNTNRLESILEEMGEAVITATQTVECLAERLDSLTIKMEQQEEQIKQQGYQIFALSESLQTLVEINSESSEEMRQLIAVLKSLLKISNQSRSTE